MYVLFCFFCLFVFLCIPHWCSYSSDQLYLSASIAGIFSCGIVFLVLNCKKMFKNAFLRNAFDHDKFPVTCSLWRAESVLGKSITLWCPCSLHQQYF